MIELRGKRLSGPIPPELSQLRHLEHLDLFSNQLTGSIPQSLADLPNLKHLNLAHNRLSGPIPDRIGLNQPLTYVDLSDNRLSGEIPPSLVAPESLTHVNLSYNKLTGGIPREFHSTSQLEHLDLMYNQLTFEIPFEIERLRKLKRLHLNNNRLTGQIPPNLSKLPQLESVDLTSNRLTGEIPSGLSKLDRLNLLYVDHNLLTGTVPAELARARSLWFLGITENQFTGCIPTELRDIEYSNIEYANVTYCDAPPRTEPYSPPYIEWVIGDTIKPSQERAARLGVERVAKFVEKVGWPLPSETITVYFADYDTLAHHYANRRSSCGPRCARGWFEWERSDVLPGAVFAQTWYTSALSLDHEASLVAQQTMAAIALSWLTEHDPFGTTWDPVWWVYGLSTFVDTLAEADQRDLDYKEHRDFLSGLASSNFSPLSSLESTGEFTSCPGYCGAMAIELLASQVGLRTLANYYTQRIPRTDWKQTFKNTFNITIRDFYELYEEQYDQRFPYLELPIEGNTQWPRRDTSAD